MNFVNEHELIVENGPIGTRLKYEHGYEAFYNICQDDIGKQILIDLYKGDIAIAQNRKIPIIINAPTYRLSRNHLKPHGIKEKQTIRQLNIDSLQLVIDLKKEMESDSPIICGAAIGSMYDAYSLQRVPSVEESFIYHQEQISFFKETSIDFINAVTFPTIDEPLGLALACYQSGLDYTIGFILNNEGDLFDGNSLDFVIDTIDSKVERKPLGYLVTCTHPSSIKLLVDKKLKNEKRLIGIQANGSSLSPGELAALNQPLADEPRQFAQDIKELKERLNLQILGGCCGTNKEHLFCIIESCL